MDRYGQSGSLGGLFGADFKFCKIVGRSRSRTGWSVLMRRICIFLDAFSQWVKAIISRHWWVTGWPKVWKVLKCWIKKRDQVPGFLQISTQLRVRQVSYVLTLKISPSSSNSSWYPKYPFESRNTSSHQVRRNSKELCRRSTHKPQRLKISSCGIRLSEQSAMVRWVGLLYILDRHIGRVCVLGVLSIWLGGIKWLSVPDPGLFPVTVTYGLVKQR